MKRAPRAAVPAAIVALIVSFLCPTEFSLYVEGLRLPPHRVALIVLLPFALWRLATKPGLKVRGFDLAMFAYAGWTLFVYASHTEGREGFVYGGSLVLEAIGSYLVARAYIRDLDTFRATLRAMMLAIGAAAMVALPETLLGKTFVHDALRELTGYQHPTAIETRLGLARAYGTFDHPIHYGTFCAALFALYWYGERRARRRHGRAALLTGATFLGLSSAPLLCIGLQAAMLVWESFTRRVAARVAITLTVLGGLYIGMSAVATRSPIAFIATGMTLDPWTGFYRLQIWENGLQNVWNNPWYGIGLADWDRPAWMVSATVDAFWLVIAMRTGIPAFLLLALALVLLAGKVARRAGAAKDRDTRRLALGWMMSLIALVLVGCTVHYWNVLHAYFFFFVGLGGWIADPRKAASPARGAAPALAARRGRPLAASMVPPLQPVAPRFA
jgi:hypothetical protein